MEIQKAAEKKIAQEKKVKPNPQLLIYKRNFKHTGLCLLVSNLGHYIHFKLAKHPPNGNTWDLGSSNLQPKINFLFLPRIILSSSVTLCLSLTYISVPLWHIYIWHIYTYLQWLRLFWWTTSRKQFSSWTKGKNPPHFSRKEWTKQLYAFTICSGPSVFNDCGSVQNKDFTVGP